MFEHESEIDTPAIRNKKGQKGRYYIKTPEIHNTTLPGFCMSKKRLTTKAAVGSIEVFGTDVQTGPINESSGIHQNVS